MKYCKNQYFTIYFPRKALTKLTFVLIKEQYSGKTNVFYYNNHLLIRKIHHYIKVITLHCIKQFTFVNTKKHIRYLHL